MKLRSSYYNDMGDLYAYLHRGERPPIVRSSTPRLSDEQTGELLREFINGKLTHGQISPQPENVDVAE